MNAENMKDFAIPYTAAWCSQDAAAVAVFYAENGSLKINDRDASVGREAITQAAQGFMTAFPDMAARMDDLRVTGGQAVYHWTLTGTNTGPGGTGKAVRISGLEEWAIDEDGLIIESLGHLDEEGYHRQLQYGAGSIRLRA